MMATKRRVKMRIREACEEDSMTEFMAWIDEYPAAGDAWLWHTCKRGDWLLWLVSVAISNSARHLSTEDIVGKLGDLSCLCVDTFRRYIVKDGSLDINAVTELKDSANVTAYRAVDAVSEAVQAARKILAYGIVLNDAFIIELAGNMLGDAMFMPFTLKKLLKEEEAQAALSECADLIRKHVSWDSVRQDL
jgi:hypothetical protein